MACGVISFVPRLDLIISITYFLGGRQLDGSVPALYALERIMKSPKVRAAQQSGKLTVLYDSGIRTGPDIFKALALGAQAILCEVLFSKDWCILLTSLLSMRASKWLALGYMA
jgi:hypothetical protein